MFIASIAAVLSTLPVALSSISICIALVALSVAIWNFRLSRFPHVRLLFHIYHSISKEFPTGAHLFDVEVESWGLPIYDLKVWLLADYRLGYSETIGEISFELEPVGSRPNPLNPGQVVKFRTTSAFVQQRDEAPTTKPRTFGLSDLPPERVCIVVNGSGGREVKRVTSDRFGPMFWSFDCVNTAVRMAKWEKHASRWRRWSGVNLFDKMVVIRMRPRLHALRVKVKAATEMRRFMRNARKSDRYK